MKPKKQKGFTLLELMIVVAVIAVIASIAVPSYRDYIRKARRFDAVTTLLDIGLHQERYRAVFPQYATNLEMIQSVVAGYDPNSRDIAQYFTFSTSGSATGLLYSATAVAKSEGAQNSDTEDGKSCATLRMRKTTTAGTTEGPNGECFGD